MLSQSHIVRRVVRRILPQYELTFILINKTCILCHAGTLRHNYALKDCEPVSSERGQVPLCDIPLKNRYDALVIDNETHTITNSDVVKRPVQYT